MTLRTSSWQKSKINCKKPILRQKACLKSTVSSERPSGSWWGHPWGSWITWSMRQLHWSVTWEVRGREVGTGVAIRSTEVETTSGRPVGFLYRVMEVLIRTTKLKERESFQTNWTQRVFLTSQHSHHKSWTHSQVTRNKTNQLSPGLSSVTRCLTGNWSQLVTTCRNKWRRTSKCNTKRKDRNSKFRSNCER